jgi:thioredoxin 1
MVAVCRCPYPQTIVTRPPIFHFQRYEAALTTATTSDKLLVLDVTASWCQPCKAMDRVTWVDPKVVAWLTEHAVALQIDVDEEKALASSLGIRSMPTVIAFKAGKEIDRVVGMKGAADLLAWLEGVLRGETSVAKAKRAADEAPGDMAARGAFATSLANARRYAEATEEFVWLWSHMLEHDPAMVGVRSSFMLREIVDLMGVHAPARERFAALRDAIRVDVATTSADGVFDWISLTSALGESDRMLQWIDENLTLLETRSDLAGIVRIRVVPMLIERARWRDVARFFRDPVATLRESHSRVEEIRVAPLPPGMDAMRPRMIESVEELLRRDAAVLVTALLASAREPEARAVLREARALSPGEKTEQALVETARSAGLELPSES